MEFVVILRMQFDQNASTTFGVIYAAERRHVLLTPLVHIHLTHCKQKTSLSSFALATCLQSSPTTDTDKKLTFYPPRSSHYYYYY